MLGLAKTQGSHPRLPFKLPFYRSLKAVCAIPPVRLFVVRLLNDPVGASRCLHLPHARESPNSLL